MQEKRKHKRLGLEISVQLEKLDESGITSLRYVHVDVTDISRSGIGFTSARPLEVGACYDARIQIWNGEVVEAVVEIVRSIDSDEGYRYGGVFVGMSDEDAMKIDIYQIYKDV